MRNNHQFKFVCGTALVIFVVGRRCCIEMFSVHTHRPNGETTNNNSRRHWIIYEKKENPEQSELNANVNKILECKCDALARTLVLRMRFVCSFSLRLIRHEFWLNAVVVVDVNSVNRGLIINFDSAKAEDKCAWFVFIFRFIWCITTDALATHNSIRNSHWPARRKQINNKRFAAPQSCTIELMTRVLPITVRSTPNPVKLMFGCLVAVTLRQQ